MQNSNMVAISTRKQAKLLAESSTQEPVLVDSAKLTVAGTVAKLPVVDPVAVVSIPIDESVKVPNSYDAKLAAIEVEIAINN